MGKNSSIEWTHHTFNPWWGCSKVSEACINCYAEKWSKRVGADLWGKKSERRFFTDKHWKEPLRWNAQALKNKMRSRVFCSSMADVFEDRNDLDIWRRRLWSIIGETPSLDWLLLTKRPENIKQMVPWESEWPDNVWVGVTVETQNNADRRIPYVIELPVKIKFVSCEPLLGAIDLTEWLKPKSGLKWIIVGGESGGKARPTHPDWVRSLRDQSDIHKVPFLFKQWGAWCPLENGAKSKRKLKLYSPEGERPAKLVKLSKKEAGRLLDGNIWDEYPMN